MESAKYNIPFRMKSKIKRQNVLIIHRLSIQIDI